MAFLFRSKDKKDRALASRDGNAGSQGTINSASSRGMVDEKGARSTPTGSLHSFENDGTPTSPDRGHTRRGGSLDQTQAQQSPLAQSQPQEKSDLPFRNGPQGPPVSNTNNASLYPWSQRRLTYTSSHPSPFPRYGAAINSLSSKEGDIYMMGGLINSSTVKGDLWMIEAGGNMACYPLATTAEGPGPRVGHSSLLVGNAFIVYGGDTKIDESDVLDETLYLLNTSTRQWSRALPAGPRPSGRYGHSLNIMGSKIYVFGGQVENDFMNDLSAFDLNQLQMPNNRWELLMQGEVSTNLPAARTNHSMVTLNDKMYLFGGTNGLQWFNDVWCYDPVVNEWTELDCIGYIPAPREGHAAAIVDDVMYVFGGRTEEGTDLGDLAAFRITTRRWYTFQNMGPSPSPRSGHGMTTVGKSIVTFAGEPSSAGTVSNDLGILYVLDTTKIRYPTDAQQNQKLAQSHTRRPSLNDSQNAIRPSSARDGSVGPTEQRRIMGANPNTSAPNGHRSPPPNGVEGNFQNAAVAAATTQSSKLPRAAPGAAGPPPSGPVPQRPGADSSMGRARGPSADRTGASSSPVVGSSQHSPISREVIPENVTVAPNVNVNGRQTPTQAPQQQPAAAPVKSEVANVDGPKNNHIRQSRIKTSVDSSIEPGMRLNGPRPASPPPPTRQPSNPLSRRSSGRNSQTVVLLKELDSARNRNAWYASELELARKAGYSPTATSSSVLDGKPTETFDDEDRPLIEALLAMRTELANVQNAVDKQAASASRQISEVEKQRDAAIQEALYAKAKLAAYPTSGAGDRAYSDEAAPRHEEMSKKLSSMLQLQKGLQSQLDQARSDLDNEKRARKLADDTTNAAQKRMADLEAYKQQTSTEVERLKAELHMAQREAREQSVASAEAVGALELLKAEKDEIAKKHEEIMGTSQSHSETFGSLRAAIAASEDGKLHLQNKLDEEREVRERLEDKLNKLKAEHEARTNELVTTTQRLRDAEEVAEKHANEAKTHREAVLAGLDKITLRDEPKERGADNDRIAVLQKQVVTSTALVKKYQEEADIAADKLRSAEERIAGLEQYQEQSSREGVGIRRQLQSALRDTQSLQASNTELKNQLAAQQLETNAMNVQHSALKNILSERGISPTSVSRNRGLTSSPRTATPDQGRLRELESQLANAHASHEETKQSFAIQAQESETMYREKLSQLENDYRSAVHYVKGTEQMLKQLKEQLNRYKSENSQLKNEIEGLEDRLQADGQKDAAPADWETERASLQQKIESLEAELRQSGATLQNELENLRSQLVQSNRQRDEAIQTSDQASVKLTAQLKNFEQLRSENMQLEHRATEAEQKVSLLLDQVEHSVDNYRRSSRQVNDLNAAEFNTNGLGVVHGHNRNDSADLESTYSGTNNVSDARNSAALDNLASELETLRTHWEATNKNYRLSTNFDLDPNTTSKKQDDAGTGLSESLADWRKKLDTEERASAADNAARRV